MLALPHVIRKTQFNTNLNQQNNQHNDHNYHKTNNQHNEFNQNNAYNYPANMSLVYECHIPENVVDQMNNVLVQEILFLDISALGRVTDTQNKIDSGTAQQAMKQIMLTYPIQPP